MSKPNEYDTYIIPPNFIEGGTFFGGLLKLRNTAEALVIVLAIGIPVFSVSALTLTAKIIILCLTALPLGIIALVGINGESLSSFIFLVLKYLCNRRVITRNEEEQDKRKKRRKRKAKSGDDAPKYINPVAEYLPVEKIENGIIYTRDHRYLKIVEVIPINFLLRSAREQRNIIYSFISFLKISPVKMQIKVIAKRADLNRHREIVQQEMAQETDENCRLLQQDYLTLIDRIGAREATSRRFFMVFEYEAWAGRKRDNEEAEAIASLQTAARTAVNYLKQCGNEVLIPENDDEFTVDTLYHLLCRNTTTSLPDRVRRIVAQYQEKGLESEIDAIKSRTPSPVSSGITIKKLSIRCQHPICSMLVLPQSASCVVLGFIPSGSLPRRRRSFWNTSWGKWGWCCTLSPTGLMYRLCSAVIISVP